MLEYFLPNIVIRTHWSRNNELGRGWAWMGYVALGEQLDFLGKALRGEVGIRQKPYWGGGSRGRLDRSRSFFAADGADLRGWEKPGGIRIDP